MRRSLRKIVDEVQKAFAAGTGRERANLYWENVPAVAAALAARETDGGRFGELCAYALNRCCRTIEELGKGMRWSLPPLYMSEFPGNESKDSDHAFVVGIVRDALRNFEKYSSEIAALTPKWDRSRICTTDLALIVSGMAEASAFPSMPAKVIINEYVEISKYYSTPDSRAFVNGLLDKLINKG